MFIKKQQFKSLCVGDHVFLPVEPRKSSLKLGSRAKLTPR
jgi:hypothetical protein